MRVVGFLILAVGVLATAVLIAQGPRGRDWRRQMPDRHTTYQLGDGGCVSFARLPLGWSPSPLDTDDASAEFEGQIGLVKVRGGVFLDRYRLESEAGAIGIQRQPERDTAGLKAWYADDGEYVLADGDRDHYSLIVVCMPGNREYGLKPRCIAKDRQARGSRVVAAEFPWQDAGQAKVLLAGVKAVASSLPAPCPAPKGAR